MEAMERRDFIRRTLQAALSLTVAGAVPVLDLWPLKAAAADMPALAVRTGADIQRLVAETLAALGGMEHFVKRGETVVVKPNIGWDRTPEQGANTHPLVVKTVVEHCLEAGAKRVLLFDRSYNFV